MCGARLPNSGRLRATRGADQSGSTLVVAVVLVMALTVLAGTVTARSVGSLSAATAAHDRLLARAIAEDVLHSAIDALDEVASRTGQGVREASKDLEAALASSSWDEVDVAVALEEDAEGIVVQVDAAVGAANATATARLRARSSADLAWLVEHSAQDPLLQGRPRLACARSHEDEDRDPACAEMPMPWGSVTGPVHTNDGVGDWNRSSAAFLATSSAVDDAGAAHRSEILLPRDVITVLGDLVPTCRFRGPTLIRFDGPRIRVTSPRSAPRSDDPIVPGEEIGCLGVDRAMLGAVVAVELPASAVIEVIPDRTDDCVLHPLGIDPVEDPERAWRCDGGDAFVWGRYAGARTVLAHDSIQIVWDVEPGDASGPRSLAHGDVLGLVAGDSVVLRRPIGVDPLATFEDVVAFAGPGIAPFAAHPLDAPLPTPSTWESPHVVASVAALRGSFAPQNSGHGRGPTGRITVVGSVASRFAPPTRTPILFFGWFLGWREFPLTVDYDTRLEVAPPPALPRIDGGRLRIVEMEVG